MGRLGRDIYGRKLRDFLSRSSDEAFFQLVWAIDALQSGRADYARNLITYPAAAETADIASKYYAHKWSLETLINEILVTPKFVPPKVGAYRLVDCSQFDAFAVAIRLLHKLENAEDAIVLKRVDVLKEVHRLAQRQFEWQRGYLNIPTFYRSAYVFGDNCCHEYFEAQYGLRMTELSAVGAGLYASLAHQSAVRRDVDLSEIGITGEKLEAALRLLALPHAQARILASKLRSKHLHTAYQPSILRLYPCVLFGTDQERLRAPLLELILLRVTSGLYYDLVPAGADVRNAVGRRFEQYCQELLEAMLPSLAVTSSYKYRFSKNDVETPDLFIRKNGEVHIAVECKAKRMTFEARFSEDPLAEARVGYDEIVKGVFQLWRFFSHCRRGVIESETIHANAVGMVLTLDTWLTMAGTLKQAILQSAREMVESREPEILMEDCRPVLFCPIPDLEITLNKATEDSFIDAVWAAPSDRFSGWMLPNVHEAIAPQTDADKIYPFADRLGDLLPWWAEHRERQSA